MKKRVGILTAGGDCPGLNATIRGVAKALGHPIAAPSANRFGHISPTSAGAVLKELGGLIPLVLDAGACSEGLESTILQPCLDEKGKPAVRLLREGPVTREKLRGICRVLRKNEKAAKSAADGDEAHPNAPGQLKSHYAPTKPLLLHDPREPFTPEEGLRYGLISYQFRPFHLSPSYQVRTMFVPSSLFTRRYRSEQEAKEIRTR